MKLLAGLLFAPAIAMAVEAFPLVVRSEDIYSNPIPFFYQPSRVIICKKCSPETIEQLKMWEQLSTKDWATDFDKNAEQNQRPAKVK